MTAEVAPQSVADMAAQERRPRKRVRSKAVTIKAILGRFTVGGTPKDTVTYELTAAEQRLIIRALGVLADYDDTRFGRVRFLADAYQGAGCVEIASRDTRVGHFTTQIYGPVAVTLHRAIEGKTR